MTRLPDTSVWFTPERAMAEHVQWVLAGHWKRQMAFLKPRMEREGVQSVVEFGCGSGLLAAGLPAAVNYTGIDANQWFVRKAIERNVKADTAQRCFIHGDGRTALVQSADAATWDLSIAFAFLKNFALDEWHVLLARVLSAGKFGAFDVQMAETAFDDGTEFHHVFVTEDMLKEAIAGAGHEEVERETTAEWEHNGGKCRSVTVWTRRKEPSPFAEIGRLKTEAEKKEDEARLWKAALRPVCTNIVEDLKKVADGTPSEEDVKKIIEVVNQKIVKAAVETAAGTLAKLTAPILLVDGLMPPDGFDNWSLRWTASGTPVLYHHGKRVTKPWSVRLAHDEPADPYGGNANTAE